MDNVISVAVWAVWTAASAFLLLKLRVFSSRPLRAAPRRRSELSLFHLAAVALLYIGATLGAALALQPAAGPGSRAWPPPAATVGTTTPAAAGTARSASPVAAAQSAPARTARGPEEHPLRDLAADCIGKLAAAAVMIVLASALVKHGLRGFGLHPGMLPWGVAKGALAMFIMAPLLYAVMFVTQFLSNWIRHANHFGPEPVHPILEALQSQGLSWPELALLIGSAVIVAPLAEELFFRGFLQTALIRFGAGRERITQMWRWVAILLASALFASIHLSGGNYEVLPTLFLLALALGYVYERTGNLWAAMTVHLLFNTISIVATLLDKL